VKFKNGKKQKMKIEYILNKDYLIIGPVLRTSNQTALSKILKILKIRSKPNAA
jgi:hypothetical protein